MADAEFTIDMRMIKFFVLVAFLAVVAFLEMSLVVNSPIAFGDEALHTSIARWMSSHRDYPVNIPQIGTDIYKTGFFRSPLWNITLGSFYFLFGFSELIVKLLVPFIAVMTALTVYILVSKLFSQNAGIIAGLVTIAVPSYVTYSVLFYPEALLVLYMSITFLATFLAFKTNRRKYIFLAGIFAGLSVLTDASGFTAPIFFALVFLWQMFRSRSIANTFRFWLPAIIVFLVVISPYMLRNITYYKTPFCQFPTIFSVKQCTPEPEYTAKYSFEGVLSSGQTGIELFTSGILSWLSFAYGFLFFVPVFAVAGIVLSAYRRELTEMLLLISLLAFAFIFYQSLTGRVEDLTRNLVSSTAIVALFAGLYADEMGEFLKRYQKSLFWIVIFFAVALSFLMVRDRIDTLASVKAFSPLFFETCNWVKQNLPENSMLLSFNTAPTVYNCERQAQWNLVDGADIILSQNVTLAKERLKANGFTHIFVQKFSITQQKISGGYWTGFLDMMNQNPIDFKVVYENGPDLLTCVRQGGCDGTVIYQIVY